MKKFTILFLLLVVLSCQKDDFFIETYAPQSLQIDALTGIRFSEQSPTDGTLYNLKTDNSGVYTVEILDLTKTLVSRNTLKVIEGDNIYTLYTRAIEPGDYTFRFLDQNGIEKESIKLFIK